MRTSKKKWARYALPEGFAERGYPKDLSCHMTSKNMMGRKNPSCGYETIDGGANSPVGNPKRKV
jgi:hypothetical protein